MLTGLARPTAAPDRRAWSLTAFAAVLGLAMLVRIALWPTAGLVGDLDQFVLWVHGLATVPFGNAYDQNLSFPPVMAYIWGALAALEPAFKTVTTSADPAIRAIMKAPASIADLMIGGLIAWHLRATTLGAVVAVLWLPFIPAGGVAGYARNVAAYQSDIFAILSLRAWNLWWLVQELLAGGSFVSDQGAVLGPITLRHVGYGLALLGELAVF